MNRVTFIIDGFNLYHSVREAAKLLNSPTKWLNIKDLCSVYLGTISGIVSEKTTLESIYYFSAFAKHLLSVDPKVVVRHKKLIKCLEDSGIQVELSRFKSKEIRCPLKNNYCIKR